MNEGCRAQTQTAQLAASQAPLSAALGTPGHFARTHAL